MIRSNKLNSSPKRHYSASAAVVTRFVCVVTEFDLIGELVVHLDLRLLGERVLGDGLEGLLHINSFLGRRLKVRDVAFAVTPLLRSLRRHLKQQQHQRRSLYLHIHSLWSTIISHQNLMASQSSWGSFTNDVNHIFGIFDPPPPLSTFFQLSSTFHNGRNTIRQLCLTPPPFPVDVICERSLGIPTVIILPMHPVSLNRVRITGSIFNFATTDMKSSGIFPHQSPLVRLLLWRLLPPDRLPCRLSPGMHWTFGNGIKQHRNIVLRGMHSDLL